MVGYLGVPGTVLELWIKIWEACGFLEVTLFGVLVKLIPCKFEIPGTQMTLVLIGKDLVLGSWPSKIEVIWVPGRYLKWCYFLKGNACYNYGFFFDLLKIWPGICPMFGIYVFVLLETYSPSPIFGKVAHWTRQDASQLGRDASEIRINPLRPMVYFWQRYVAENNQRIQGFARKNHHFGYEDVCFFGWFDTDPTMVN